MLTKTTAEEILSMVKLNISGFTFCALLKYASSEEFVVETYKIESPSDLYYWDQGESKWQLWLSSKTDIEYVINQLEKPDRPDENFFYSALEESKGLFLI